MRGWGGINLRVQWQLVSCVKKKSSATKELFPTVQPGILLLLWCILTSVVVSFCSVVLEAMLFFQEQNLALVSLYKYKRRLARSLRMGSIKKREILSKN